MKKRVFNSIFVAVATVFLFSSCNKYEEILNPEPEVAPLNLKKGSIKGNEPGCPDDVGFDLIAGRTHDAGSVIVTNDEENLTVTFVAESGWKLKETHLYVGSFEEILRNKRGIPVPGLFPYATQHVVNQKKHEVNHNDDDGDDDDGDDDGDDDDGDDDDGYDDHGDDDGDDDDGNCGNGGITSYTYTIPLEGLDECFVILAHAKVVKEGKCETAWGSDGTSFESFDNKEKSSGWRHHNKFDKEGKGFRWGFLINYCIQQCEKESVFAIKTWFRDPTTNHSTWAVTSGETFADGSGCSIMGYNVVEKGTTKEYDIIHASEGLFGKAVVYDDGEYLYIDVYPVRDDYNLLYATHLYVGTLDGLMATIDAAGCPDYVNFPYLNSEYLVSSHSFKIAFSDFR